LWYFYIKGAEARGWLQTAIKTGAILRFRKALMALLVICPALATTSDEGGLISSFQRYWSDDLSHGSRLESQDSLGLYTLVICDIVVAQIQKFLMENKSQG
jgi:hypothetical protein